MKILVIITISRKHGKRVPRSSRRDIFTSYRVLVLCAGDVKTCSKCSVCNYRKVREIIISKSAPMHLLCA